MTILTIVLLYTSDESDVKVRGSMYVSVPMYVEHVCLHVCVYARVIYMCVCMCVYLCVNVSLKGMSLSDH